MTRNGKIARWPAAIRTELNQRRLECASQILDDSQGRDAALRRPGRRSAPTLPKTEMRTIFDGGQGQPLEEKGAENDAMPEKTKNQAASWSWPRFRRVEKPGTNVARPLTQFKQI
jgi:hypothetical protein